MHTSIHPRTSNVQPSPFTPALKFTLERPSTAERVEPGSAATGTFLSERNYSLPVESTALSALRFQPLSTPFEREWKAASVSRAVSLGEEACVDKFGCAIDLDGTAFTN